MFPPPWKNKQHRQHQDLDVKWVPYLPSIDPKEEDEKAHAPPQLIAVGRAGGHKEILCLGRNGSCAALQVPSSEM